MTPQERALLENFLTRLTQVRGTSKDPEAERMIAQAAEQQPDAMYLAVQRALLVGQALEQAKARIAELEQAAAGRDQRFLDPNASGWGNPGPLSRGQPSPQNPGYGPGGSPPYAAPQGYGGPPGYPTYGAPPPGYPAYGSPAPVGGAFSG